MTCEDTKDYVQRNFDDDLTLEEKAIMDEHLQQCSECQTFKERLDLLCVELANLPQVDPPFSLVDSILPKLEGKKEQQASKQNLKKTSVNWKRWASLGGGLAAAVAFVLIWNNGLNNSMDNAGIQMESASQSEAENDQEITVLSQLEESPEMKMMLVAPVQGGVSFVSPNGEWIAQQEGNRIVVRGVDEAIVFESHSWEQEVEHVTLEWTDPMSVTYTLQFAQEDSLASSDNKISEKVTIEQWVIDIEQRLEHRQ